MIGLENTSSTISASNIAGMYNVHWDDHYYNWVSGYSTSVSDNLSAIQGGVARIQAYTDTQGTIPVIIGEYR